MNTIDLANCTMCGTVIALSYQLPSVSKEQALKALKDEGKADYEVSWTRVHACPSCRTLRIFNEFSLIGERTT